MKTIDFVLPKVSQYGVLDHFTKKLYQAALRQDYQARLLSLSSDLQKLVETPADITIGFNGVPQLDYKLLCDLTKKPFISLLVDPFYRFLPICSHPLVALGCDDFASVDSLRKQGCKQCFFLPHAVEVDLFDNPPLEKIYDVSFLATFIDFEKRRLEWIRKYPKELCEAMDLVIEQTFSSNHSFVHLGQEAMRLFFQNHPEKGFDIVSVFADLELYIKGKERFALLNSIKETPVHVFGNSIDNKGWKEAFSNQSNIICHEAVSYEEGLNIQKQSKIVLNSSIKNQFGAHERIFSGLAAGALVFTQKNVYLSEYFTHDVDIAFFENADLSFIDEQLAFYLKQDSWRQMVALNGKKVVKQHHTWDTRFFIIKNEAIRFFP